MKTITTTVYNYSELSESAKETAREWLQECATIGEWWEYTYDLWKKALNSIGFIDADISFSGFWNQGDGASFTSRIDTEKLVPFLTTETKPSEVIDDDNLQPWVAGRAKPVMDKRFIRLARFPDYLKGGVRRTSHHYSHKNTCETEIELYTCRTYRKIESLVSDFEKSVEDLRKNLCDAIYVDLEQEYNWLTSEEQLAELAESNEYTFTESGRRFG